MPTQCSAPGWVSGGTTGHGIDGYRFEPFRVREGQPWQRRHQHGDAHGRLFSSADEGARFSLERGYSVAYRGPYAVGRKVHRKALAMLHTMCIDAIMACPSRTDLIATSDLYSGLVGELFGNGQVAKRWQFTAGMDIGARTHWSLGYWAAARKLRPDLFQPPEHFAWSPAKQVEG